jgi:threonine dehydrogenase-like Zn-dependent dehydrogenase
MKAIVLDTPGQFRHVDLEAPPTPGPGEALVRVRWVGVCGTDFHVFRGEQPFFTYPRILGVDGHRDPLAVLHDLVADDLPTAVFDATGSSRSMMAAFSYVAHGGRLIFVGLVQGNVTCHDPEFHRRELTTPE